MMAEFVYYSPVKPVFEQVLFPIIIFYLKGLYICASEDKKWFIKNLTNSCPFLPIEQILDIYLQDLIPSRLND